MRDWLGSTIPDWMPLFYYCSRRKCDETYSDSTFPKTWIQKCKTFLNVALPNWSIIDSGLVGPWTVWPDLCKIPPLWRNNLKSLQFIWGFGQSFQLTIGHIFIAESGQILKRQFGHLVTFHSRKILYNYHQRYQECNQTNILQKGK